MKKRNFRTGKKLNGEHLKQDENEDLNSMISLALHNLMLFFVITIAILAVYIICLICVLGKERALNFLKDTWEWYSKIFLL